MICLKCKKDISDSYEDGVNGSDYYECWECKKGYNVTKSDLKE